MSARLDREDLTEQTARLASARTEWAAALDWLAWAATDEHVPFVAAEAKALAKALRSKAKRPPHVDGSDLAGLAEAAGREVTRSNDFDEAVRRAKAAEMAVDMAAYDLSTAGGADG